ncbi:hypothetical protein D3C80_962650 [compost metagenome]
METTVERYLQLIDSVMNGADDYESLCLRGKSITERNEFVGLVQEFKKESLPLRIHQVCGSYPAVVVFFQWCLGYSDRYAGLVECWTGFVAYSKKNAFDLKFPLNRSLVFMMQLFEGIYNRVVEYRQKQAA